ncbi:MAG: hypothetical protein SAJ12_01030 [Jaaginema sp. PMC 1079.18]|nr:hypothetical protein [Jaaginema sp. PMC 1080.18]MEC4849568.1 hypothetical protein [Jaaginema sp. PMC 1079.18]MEC4866573.1 hypothetical protein [Jaaginema sp. PMC 1078.18]
MMGKKIGIAAGILSLLSFCFGFYWWRQLTKVPDWYSAETTPVAQQMAETQLLELQQSRQAVFSSIERQVRQNPSSSEVTVTLTDDEINDVLVAGMVENLAGTEVLQATRGINTTIADDTIEIGMVVNTADLNLNSAENSIPVPAIQALQQFPLLKNRDLYVGLSSQPQIVNGQLQLTEDTHVRIGNLSLSLAEISRKSGMTEAEILQTANQALATLNIRDLQLQDGQITIKRDRF